MVAVKGIVFVVYGMGFDVPSTRSVIGALFKVFLYASRAQGSTVIAYVEDRIAAWPCVS
jgi:hypothetical protein